MSILMANRNYARFIGEAIESALTQSYRNLEIVVCDDASEDDSVDVIKRLMRRDDRVRLVRHSTPGGQGAAFSEIFGQTSGQIICFLDSDDLFVTHKIERVVEFFKAHPTTGLLTHPGTVVDAAGRPSGRLRFRTRLEHGWIADKVVRRGGRLNHMPYGGIVVRREVAELAFPVPIAVRAKYSDGYLTMIAALTSDVASISDPLYLYRVHDQNVMHSSVRGAQVSRDEVEGMQCQVAATNERAERMGLGMDILDISRNLNYRQHVYLLALFAGDRRSKLANAFVPLAKMLLADDLYGWPERLLRVVIYGAAIPMPLWLRTRWLLASRSPRGYLRHARQRVAEFVGRKM